MYSFSRTEGWYEGRPVASGSTPPKLSSARSSSSTNTSIARTGLSSQIQSSRHSGNSVLCPRSAPSTNRFISPSAKSRRNHNVRITPATSFLHSQGHNRKNSRCPLDVRFGRKQTWDGPRLSACLCAEQSGDRHRIERRSSTLRGALADSARLPSLRGCEAARASLPQSLPAPSPPALAHQSRRERTKLRQIIAIQGLAAIVACSRLRRRDT